MELLLVTVGTLTESFVAVGDHLTVIRPARLSPAPETLIRLAACTAFRSPSPALSWGESMLPAVRHLETCAGEHGVSRVSLGLAVGQNGCVSNHDLRF